MIKQDYGEGMYLAIAFVPTDSLGPEDSFVF
jgi:hypothetical protein